MNNAFVFTQMKKTKQNKTKNKKQKIVDPKRIPKF